MQIYLRFLKYQSTSEDRVTTRGSESKSIIQFQRALSSESIFAAGSSPPTIRNMSNRTQTIVNFHTVCWPHENTFNNVHPRDMKEKI
jgi:hypothetical protein